MHTYIYIVLFLKEILNRLFGEHYPKEIIQLIILKFYHRFKVSCGYCLTALINEKVYMWGFNSSGQLGLGYAGSSKNRPQQLTLDSNVISIKCGRFHTAILMKNGDLYGIGTLLTNEDAQDICKPLKLMSSIKKIYCGDQVIIAMTKNNEIYVWGAYSLHEKYYSRKLEVSNITSISCGGDHLMLLSENINKIYACGKNNHGQLGLGDNVAHAIPKELFLPDILKISCGTDHTIAISKTNSILFVWGSNEDGQLGLGDRINRNTPHELNFLWGQIVSVKCGKYYTIALTKSGDIYSWGSNDCYRLGLGDSIDRLVPHKISLSGVMTVGCGDTHVIAVTMYHEVYVWGDNESGQLGLGDYIDQKVPRRLEFKF